MKVCSSSREGPQKWYLLLTPPSEMYGSILWGSLEAALTAETANFYYTLHLVSSWTSGLLITAKILSFYACCYWVESWEVNSMGYTLLGFFYPSIRETPLRTVTTYCLYVLMRVQSRVFFSYLARMCSRKASHLATFSASLGRISLKIGWLKNCSTIFIADALLRHIVKFWERSTGPPLRNYSARAKLLPASLIISSTCSPLLPLWMYLFFNDSTSAWARYFGLRLPSTSASTAITSFSNLPVSWLWTYSLCRIYSFLN